MELGLSVLRTNPRLEIDVVVDLELHSDGREIDQDMLLASH
jgi:hypothetical protein